MQCVPNSTALLGSHYRIDNTRHFLFAIPLGLLIDPCTGCAGFTANKFSLDSCMYDGNSTCGGLH